MRGNKAHATAPAAAMRRCGALLLVAGAALLCAGCGSLSYEHPLPPHGNDMRAGTLTIKPRPGFDRPPVFVSGPAPIYPLEAQLDQDEGSATVAFTVGKDGLVHDLKLVEASDKPFGDHLLIAAAQWTFQPALQAGSPADFTGVSFGMRFCAPAPGVISICGQ